MVTTNGTATDGIPPKITLYTNHSCPFAHRVHILLKDLNLPFEEVIIDLDTPREPWYLEINPRGLVPSMKFSNGILEDEIITESAIVAQFLADTYPSHVLPSPRETPTSALERARISFFADTFGSKIFGKAAESLRMKDKDEEQKVQKAAELAENIRKEIEPPLKDAAPFFGGKNDITFAEVLAAPMALRIRAWANGGMIHASIHDELATLPNYTKWVDALEKNESVNYIWDEKRQIEKTKARLWRFRGEPEPSK